MSVILVTVLALATIFMVFSQESEFHHRRLTNVDVPKTHPRIPPTGKCSANESVVDDGGWCLIPSPTGDFLGPSRPLAKFHIRADRGIAHTVYGIVGPNHSLIDLGAGIGAYQVYFADNNMTFTKYLAYDGGKNVEEFTFGSVRYLNLALRVDFYPHEVSDWVLSLEVGEHIPKEYQDIYIDNLHRANRNGIIISWAIPHQYGHSHVNCKSNDDIIKIFTELGYAYCSHLSEKGRKRAKYSWFKKTFMVFKRSSEKINGKC